MVAIGDSMQLRREDILDFPADTIKLILDMQKDGWRAQRSSKNHVMLLAPDGETRLGASRNPSSAKYLSEDLRRYNKAQGKEEVVPVKVKTVIQKHSCPRPGCPKAFATEEALNVHIDVEHEGMIKCPDCNKTFFRASALGRHRQAIHGYVSPNRAKRLEQEAKRKEKDEEIEHSEHMVGIAEVMGNSSRAGLPPYEGDLVETRTEGLLTRPHVDIKRVDPESVSIYIEPDPQDVEHISFIDDRDSWTLDLEDILDMDIRTLARVLGAAGLKLELRTWKGEG
jgi:uncharacterized C2H2 Zn-finger protein